MLKFDALKYPPSPSEITAYQVTTPQFVDPNVE